MTKSRSTSIVEQQKFGRENSSSSSLQKANNTVKRDEAITQSSSEDEPTPYMLGDQEIGSRTPPPETHVCEEDSDTVKDPLMDMKEMHGIQSGEDLNRTKAPKEVQKHQKHKEKKKKKKKKKKTKKKLKHSKLNDDVM